MRFVINCLILLNYYNTIANPSKALKMVGIEIIKPYFIKSKKVYFTFCLAIKSVNIMPASAPIGVKNAPTLEPIIVLKIAWLCSSGVLILGMVLNKTLIGILFNRLAERVEVSVKVTASILFPVHKSELIF